ncbi:MAG: hypothetical protein H6868_09250 [Rhodospirillales bacterium]|nr:hypothetical protein [Rhodospirillales bacterium]
MRPFVRERWLLVLALCLPLFLVGSCNVPHAFSRAHAATGNEAQEGHSVSSHQVSVLQKLVQNDPASLLSLRNGDVLDILDVPQLKRQEGSMQVWQYRSEGCVVDVYVDSKKNAVLHYELRQRTKAVLGQKTKRTPPEDGGRCVRSVIAQKHGWGQLFAALR